MQRVTPPGGCDDHRKNKGAPEWLTRKRSSQVWQKSLTKRPALKVEDVQLDKSFTEDLDIDSISMMTIVVNAEEKFEVTIPDEEVKNLKTVGDAVEFIANAA